MLLILIFFRPISKLKNGPISDLFYFPIICFTFNMGGFHDIDTFALSRYQEEMMQRVMELHAIAQGNMIAN